MESPLLPPPKKINVYVDQVFDGEFETTECAQYGFDGCVFRANTSVTFSRGCIIRFYNCTFETRAQVRCRHPMLIVTDLCDLEKGIIWEQVEEAVFVKNSGDNEFTYHLVYTTRLSKFLNWLGF